MSERTTRERLELRILGAIADRPPAHAVDLSESLDEHPVTVDEACVRLHRDGSLTTATRGLFTITDRGERRLDRTTSRDADRRSDGREADDRVADGGARDASDREPRRIAEP